MPFFPIAQLSAFYFGEIHKRFGGGCRGEISDYELEDDVLTINTETAWSEMTETRHFTESVFPGMKIYYIEEEGGCDVYNTNDTVGMFFSDRYYLDSEQYLDGHYFEAIGELKVVISEIVGHPVGESFIECEDALDKYMEEHPDEWFCLHKYQVCED